jgi:hypothetical protein
VLVGQDDAHGGVVAIEMLADGLAVERLVLFPALDGGAELVWSRRLGRRRFWS